VPALMDIDAKIAVKDGKVEKKSLGAGRCDHSNNVINIHKPMTGNGNDTTYKNGDDWGISGSSLFYPHVGLSLYEFLD